MNETAKDRDRRRWRRVYVAVLAYTLVLYLLLFWFSRHFGG